MELALILEKSFLPALARIPTSPFTNMPPQKLVGEGGNLSQVFCPFQMQFVILGKYIN